MFNVLSAYGIVMTIVILVWLHFISDFLLQSDRMATAKSSSMKWLTIHVLVYTILFLPFGWKYATVNFCLHWLTDLGSSRATTALWRAQQRHWFFVVIGFDQAVHITCLILTIPLMGW